MKIRFLEFNDIDQVTEIYNYYIENSLSTLTKKCNEDFFINKYKDKNIIFLVYEENNEIYGFVYLYPYDKKMCYYIASSISIYVNNEYTKKGIGSMLMKKILEISKEKNITNIVSIITTVNHESIKLHEKFGFTKVGNLEKVGYKFDKYIDVGFWQKII